MEKQVKQRLEKAGINVDSALARFMGNEGLFLKFLEKFLQDRSFEGLLEAVKNEDARQAFQYAHTLKRRLRKSFHGRIVRSYLQTDRVFPGRQLSERRRHAEGDFRCLL